MNEVTEKLEHNQEMSDALNKTSGSKNPIK